MFEIIYNVAFQRGFNRARFSDKVSFIGETFLGEVYFDEARFSDKVSFIGATFSQNHHTYFCNLNLALLKLTLSKNVAPSNLASLENVAFTK